MVHPCGSEPRERSGGDNHPEGETPTRQYPGRMPIVDLDQDQGFALLAEMASTRNLLAYGVRVVRTGAFIETTRDPIMTMLSIGIEKLYKLTLGLIALDRDHRWPSKSQMRGRGHGLLVMHDEVMTELQQRSAGKSHYVRSLIEKVDDDALVLPLISALDMYGRMGRFYYLDRLGEHVQDVSPEDAWQRIEKVAFEDPAVAVLHRRAMAKLDDNDAWRASTRAFHNRIAVTVERLWVAVAVCGRNHLFGETGGTFGFEVHPDAVGRQ